MRSPGRSEAAADLSLRVALARPCDVEPYIALLENVAEWLDRRGVAQIQPGTYRKFADYYVTSVAAREVYFGLIGNELVGSFRLVCDGGTVWPDSDDDSLYLENLVVRRTWSGHGFGRRLLRSAEQETLRLNKACLRLDCFANNPFLRRYYEEAGYTDCGEVEAQYAFGVLRLQRFQKLLCR
jgi:GNAT superfamily N-acetyltransferase